MNDDSDGLGPGFWLMLIGGCVAAVIAGGILFYLFGMAWYAWGLLGAFVCFGAVALGAAYIIDRREKNRRKSLAV